MGELSLELENAIDNVYNEYTRNKKILNLTADDLLQQKSKIMDNIFWKYIDSYEDANFREAVTIALNEAIKRQ